MFSAFVKMFWSRRLLFQSWWLLWCQRYKASTEGTSGGRAWEWGYPLSLGVGGIGGSPGKIWNSEELEKQIEAFCRAFLKKVWIKIWAYFIFYMTISSLIWFKWCVFTRAYVGDNYLHNYILCQKSNGPGEINQYNFTTNWLIFMNDTSL